MAYSDEMVLQFPCINAEEVGFCSPEKQRFVLQFVEDPCHAGEHGFGFYFVQDQTDRWFLEMVAAYAGRSEERYRKCFVLPESFWKNPSLEAVGEYVSRDLIYGFYTDVFTQKFLASPDRDRIMEMLRKNTVV